MRRLRSLLPLLLAACGTTRSLDDTTHPAVARPAPPNLLASATTLAAFPLQTRDQGIWRLRTIVGPTNATAGGVTGSDDFYLGTIRGGASPGPAGPTGGRGPTTGGPAGPGGGAYRGPGDTSPTAPSFSLPGSLRAGACDDNAEFDAFLGYLEGARNNPAMRGSFVDLDVRGRCALRVVDAAGKPAPGTRLQIVTEVGDQVIWRGTTYGDGRVPFYPAAARTAGATGGPYLVEVEVGERVVRHMWQGTADTEIRLPTAPSHTEPMALDVVFVIDTTGSMQDEIDAIKSTLLQTTARLRDLGREFDLRYGAVLYRDLRDVYVTSSHPFTSDVEAFDKSLGEVAAGGGGDTPESLNQGLAVAIDGMDWRRGAAKVAFLIADAPPHLDYANDVSYDRSLRAAVAHGIRVHAVAASGLDPAGSVVFRQIAQWTRGEFVFLEYGGDVAASAAAHGVGKAGTGNNLDEVLFTRIRDEIARWGV